MKGGVGRSPSPTHSGISPCRAAAVIEHLDDAARRDVAHRGADEVGPVVTGCGRSDVHVGLMDQRSGADKGFLPLRRLPVGPADTLAPTFHVIE